MAEEAQVVVDNGDGTITDTKTGLVWQKADAGPMTWREAVAACENLSLAGYTDWRLPELEECQALFKRLSDDDHVYDRRFAPFEWSGDRYWTSKVVEPYTAAFLFNFHGGTHPWEPKNSRFHVRAVRKPTDG